MLILLRDIHLCKFVCFSFADLCFLTALSSGHSYLLSFQGDINEIFAFCTLTPKLSSLATEVC